MQSNRAGLTLIELLVVIVISGILTGIASSGLMWYMADQGARNARDEYVYMAARARAAAVERARVVRLEIDPVTDRAWVVTGRSGAGDTLEVRSFTGEYLADVTTAANDTVRICYSPRGYAVSPCTNVDAETPMDFTRAGRSHRAVVWPLGQVLRP